MDTEIRIHSIFYQQVVIVIVIVAAVMLLALSSSGSHGLQPLSPSRRDLLRCGGLLAIVGSSVLFLPTELASAARGAAELDFEFYMRDLLGGNA